MQTIHWFLNRIGKRIYRDDNKCDCSACYNVLQHGLIILDTGHAEYLYETQNAFKEDGVNLNYRDKQ